MTSPYGTVEIPDVSLPELMTHSASALGAKSALVDGPSGRTITYEQFVGGMRAVASGLQVRGFAKGDVMAVFLPNLPEYALVFHGVALAGGINTTINPLYTAEELAFQLNDSKARFLVTIPQFLDRALEAKEKSGVEEVFVLGEAPGATPFTELMGAGAPEEVAIDPNEDLVVLPYSSGTTGLPKGVMLTHRNLVANIVQAEKCQLVTPEDTIIAVLPFFHIYGMNVIMNIGLHRGATVVTMPRFDLERFLQLIQDHKVTRAYLVPPIVLALAKHPIVQKYDLSNLRLIMSGAAPLGSELATACGDRIGCYVMQGYGLTETSPVTHCIPEDPGRNKPGSIGPVIPNTEAIVVDPASGEEAQPGELGEVWIRGPQVMRGYLNNDEATKITIDGDGWLHTGDIGRVDEEGYFFLVDRLKELIKYKGYQVPPAELEALIITHPRVSDVAVIGVPDEEAGEIPKAFVVTAEDLSGDELMAWVAEHVAPYKKVRRVQIVEEIPKSASGKILRRVLKEKETAAS